MCVWLELLTLALIVIGALNWGLVGAFKFDLVRWFSKKTIKGLDTFIYLLVGVAAIVHLFSRDYYLRFLGRAAFPCGAMLERIPVGADVRVSVSAPPGSNVVYWAAEPGADVKASPWIAYQENANSGVARADAHGVALLRVRNPVAYRVPMRGELKPHVHYRICEKSGMTGRVETVYL